LVQGVRQGIISGFMGLKNYLGVSNIMKNLGKLFLIGLMFLSGLALTTGNAYAKAGEAVIAPIMRPAMISNRAETSVLLSVAKAGRRLVVVGERGYILYSDDNGSSWKQASVPVSVTLTRVRFVTPKKGWAVGHSGIVLHSKDGGETWVKQLDGIEAANLAYKAAQEKLAAAGKDEKATCERRLRFAKLMVDDGPDKPFLDIYFKNEKQGFIVGSYNMIFRTQDGGNTWESWMDHVENPGGMHLYSIAAAGDKLVMVGEQGLFLRSEDAGVTFNKIPTPYNGSFFGLQVLETGELVIFGLRGYAYKSADYGDSWTRLDTKVRLAVTGATVTCDGALMMVTQSGNVLASQDKGETIKKLSIEDSFAFSGLTQALNGDLIVVGMRGVRVISNIDQIFRDDSNSISLSGLIHKKG
jgi:photosystem II stability/assembly factor-like uncharacterized protein